MQLYREADLHEEKDRISRAFGAIGDVAILKKVLQFAMSVSYPYFYRVHWSKGPLAGKNKTWVFLLK